MWRNPNYFYVNKHVKICSELFKSEDFIVFDAKKRRLKLSVKELLRHHHPNGKFLPSDEEGNYPPSLSLKFLNVPVCIWCSITLLWVSFNRLSTTSRSIVDWLSVVSKIQLVVYYQYCVLIGWATSRLFFYSPLVAKSAGFENQNNGFN